MAGRLSALAACVWLGLAAPALAQTAAPPPGPLAQPNAEPRDLRGVWMVEGYQLRLQPIDGQPIPYQPWATAEAKRRAEAQARGRQITDSTAQCMPSGIPRAMGAPYPIKILQDEKEVVILHEVQHLFQVVFLNESHPAELDRTFMGHSVGRWEGDTLVIDTTALQPGELTLLDEAGDPHSPQLHVVQRLRKIDGGRRIEDLLTIDDPGAYTRPFTVRFLFDWRPDIRLIEYICEENNRNVTTNGEVGFK